MVNMGKIDLDDQKRWKCPKMIKRTRNYQFGAKMTKNDQKWATWAKMFEMTKNVVKMTKNNQNDQN